MLPGNDQKVHGTGVLQNAPVTRGKTGAVPKHQCRQSPLAALRVNSEKALAHAIAPRRFSRCQSLTGLDTADGTNAPSQQGSLPLGEMRIDQARRTLEVHGQTPAFTTGQRRCAIPAQAHARRQLSPT
ncbi:hypothetical protein D3C80_932720 [compost metagenome]